MSFDWPTFDDEPLDDARAWSARFDSFDQRNDDIYYLVTVHAIHAIHALRATGEGERVIATFMAQVPAPAGDDWTGPAFVEELKRKLARVAATGETNTTYRGPVLRS